MPRILALDIGRKRTGIAVTDPLQISAHSLAVCSTHDVVAYIEEYCRREEVEAIVVGEPRTLRNEASEAMQYVTQVVKHIKRKLPDIPIVTHDERFTSQLASRAILEAGTPKMKRRDKGLVDKVSATIILQSYLEFKKFRE